MQARRRAGLSQRALGARASVSQQEIARYERGRVTPSLERLRALIAACGLELTVGLARADDSYDAQIRLALAADPARRLQRALRDAQPLRVAHAQAARIGSPAPADAVGLLRALTHAGVRHVLVGELAEVLRGSPLLPLTATVAIVAQAGQRDTLQALIDASGGEPQPAQPVAIDAPARWRLAGCGVDLVVAPAPPGTHGYEDLARDAKPVAVAEDLQVAVASLVDLLRIAQAGDDSAARVPALWRTLELANAAADARAA